MIINRSAATCSKCSAQTLRFDRSEDFFTFFLRQNRKSPNTPLCVSASVLSPSYLDSKARSLADLMFDSAAAAA